MSGITVIVYSTWAAFKAGFAVELYPDKAFRQGLYLFRGLGSSEHQLSTFFDRVYSRLPRGTLNKVADDLCEDFRKDVVALNLRPALPTQKEEWLALAQHSGVPTRLPDWSESPYVAAFFAFSSAVNRGAAEPSSDVAIWALNKNRMDVWDKEAGVQIIEVDANSNARMRNQEGKFTLSRTPFSCLEEYVDQVCRSEEPVRLDQYPLIKMTVPVDEAWYALSDLDAMRIRYSLLFPDTHGAAEMAKMRTAMRHFYDLSGDPKV